MNRFCMKIILICACACLLVGCANNAKDYIQNGVTFYRQKEFAGALEQFDRALKQDSGLPELYYHRGNLYRDWHNQYDKAIADYSKAIQLKDDYLLAYNNRAQIYKMRHDYDKAIKDYRKILAISPLTARAHYSIGQIYESWYQSSHIYAHLHNAKLAYDKAIEIDPENPQFYRPRCKIYVQEKKYSKAIDDYSKIIQLDPNDYTALMERGIVYFRMKKYDRAYQDLGRCQNKGFKNPKIRKYQRKILEIKNQ